MGNQRERVELIGATLYHAVEMQHQRIQIASICQGTEKNTIYHKMLVTQWCLKKNMKYHILPLTNAKLNFYVILFLSPVNRGFVVKAVLGLVWPAANWGYCLLMLASVDKSCGADDITESVNVTDSSLLVQLVHYSPVSISPWTRTLLRKSATGTRV